MKMKTYTPLDNRGNEKKSGFCHSIIYVCMKKVFAVKLLGLQLIRKAKIEVLSNT